MDNDQIKIKTLLIDDEETCLLSTSILLKGSRYEVTTAENAKEALEILKNNIIDLIILDLMLPDIHGLEFLSIIKNDFKLKHVPVVIHTGSSDWGEIQKAKKLGILGFLKKPYSKETLFCVLDKF